MLAMLQRLQRVVLVLRYFEDVSVEEAAKVLGTRPERSRAVRRGHFSGYGLRRHGSTIWKGVQRDGESQP